MKIGRYLSIAIILVLFLAMYLYGTTTSPYTGEGTFLAAVESKDGTQWADTVIRYEPDEGTRTSFSMFVFFYDSPDENAVPTKVTKTTVDYIGVCYKHVWGPLFLRPTSIHFPVILWEKGTPATISWNMIGIEAVDSELNPVDPGDFATRSYRSQLIDNTETLSFDKLLYNRISCFDAKLQPYVDALDAMSAADKAA